MNYRTTVRLNRIMAKLTIFLVVIVTLVVKDSTLSCTLRSHKDKSGSSLCSSSSSDINPTPPRSSVPKPHKIPSPCDSSSKPNLCTSNVTPGLPNVSSLPSKPTHVLGTQLPHTTSVLPSTPVDSIFYQGVLNHLIKLLLSWPTRINVPTQKILPTVPTSNNSQISGQINNYTSPPCTGQNTCTPSSPFNSTSPSDINRNSGQVNNPNTTSSPYATNSNSLSTLSSLPCGTVQSSTVKPAPGTPSTPIPGVNITDILMKFSSLFSTPSTLPLSTSKKTPLSPPCRPLFTPILNKHGVPEPNLKLQNTSHLRKPPSGLSSSHGLPCRPSSTTNGTVPTAVVVVTSEAVPEPAPEEFPVPSPASNPSNISCRYPDVINLLQKLLFPHQVRNVSSVHLPSTLPPTLPPTLSPTLPPLLSLNITPVPPQVLKPHTSPLPCKTTSGLSPCLSNGSISSAKPTQISLIPPFISVSPSGISSGYNPEYMKLLLKYLLSTRTSIPPQLLSSSTLSQQPLSNISSASSPITNQSPTLTSYEKLPDLNSSVIADTKSNISSNSISTPIIIPNTSCTSSYGSLSYVLCKLESLGYSLNLSSSLQTPFQITPINQNVHSEIPTPTPCPPLPISGLDKCRQKLSRLSKPPASSFDVGPLSHISLPHTPITPPILSPCSSHSKIISGCKK